MFSNLVRRTWKNDQNSKDSKYALTFSIALAFAESLTILWYFTRQKWQNIALFFASTWGQKLAADFSQQVLSDQKHLVLSFSNEDYKFIYLCCYDISSFNQYLHWQMFFCKNIRDNSSSSIAFDALGYMTLKKTILVVLFSPR